MTRMGVVAFAALAACGGKAVVDQVVASQTSTSTTSSSTSTSGAGGFDPVGAGGSVANPCHQECGGIFEPSGCFKCALDAGECPREYAACVADPECRAYYECVKNCSDTQCEQACYDSHPTGAGLYGEVYYCLTCSPQQCHVPCHASCTIP